jgi:hypothetical protein
MRARSMFRLYYIFVTPRLFWTRGLGDAAARHIRPAAGHAPARETPAGGGSSGRRALAPAEHDLARRSRESRRRDDGPEPNGSPARISRSAAQTESPISTKPKASSRDDYTKSEDYTVVERGVAAEPNALGRDHCLSTSIWRRPRARRSVHSRTSICRLTAPVT